MLNQLDNGALPGWAKTPAPQEAIKYYDLQPNAMMRDVILSIRADEAIHREVNHHFSDLKNDVDIENEEIQIKK